MKILFSFLTFLIAIVLSQSALGQATIEQNHPNTGNEYLGWDADTQFPLYIRHENDKAIVFETDDIERMRIGGDGRLFVGDFGSAITGTLATFNTEDFASAIRANAQGTGPINIGGRFRAGGGLYNYGVWAFASSSVAGTMNTGVARIVCGNGTNYGVYGNVCNTLMGYAGFFDGKVYTSATYKTGDENLKTDIQNPEGVAGL